MRPQAAQHRRDLGVRRGGRAGVPGRAEVLRHVEAEAADEADPAGRARIAEGLASGLVILVAVLSLYGVLGRLGPDLVAALSTRVAERVAGISVMGGSATVGNATATAEFNIWVDPEAASIVIHDTDGARIACIDLN